MLTILSGRLCLFGNGFHSYDNVNVLNTVKQEQQVQKEGGGQQEPVLGNPRALSRLLTSGPG